MAVIAFSGNDWLASISANVCVCVFLWLWIMAEYASLCGLNVDMCVVFVFVHVCQRFGSGLCAISDICVIQYVCVCAIYSVFLCESASVYLCECGSEACVKARFVF